MISEVLAAMPSRNSHIRPNDNPDITAERVKATFDTEALSSIIYGGPEKLNRRREIAKYVDDHPEMKDPYPTDFMTREMKLENVARKALLWMEHAELATDVGSQEEGFHFGSLITGIDGHPLAIHLIMAIPALLNNADDEQLDEWLPKAISRQFIATYAQTELGHGTNLSQLETTATYDPKTQEWVLNTPTITATKWWPGNLGKSSNYTVVMAQLITNGKNYGAHPFFIQIRDEKSHRPLPGITLGDIGPKFGMNANDNGFMQFDHFRVKRRAMLMKNAKVLPDGTYVPPKHPKLGYSAMIFVRSAVVGLMSLHMAQAATIGIRYSVVRRQGEITPGAGEVKILDYQTQQYRLFPQLARAFAFRLAGVHALTMYNTIMKQVNSGNTDALADLHALASGLKAVATYQTALGIEQCRFACGGHGYSLASGIPQIYTVAVGGCTYEGENMVLLLQLARYLRKRAAEMTSGKGPAEVPTPLAAYLFQSSPKHSSIGTPVYAPNGEFEGVLQTFEHVSRRLTLTAYAKLQKLEGSGISTEIALNQCAVEWRRASHAFTRVALARIMSGILEQATDQGVREVLEDIVRLYVYYEVGEAAAELLEDGFVDASQVEFARQQVYDALAKIRPNAVSLVDSFDLSDRELNSVLGRRDGNVYENLLKWAQASPLNKDDVLPFHHRYLGKMMTDAKKASKL
uniref:Acyl-coenzyme A oxidase n=1 Tax=Panagrellus redivivus TaxID=6233 RepID=A0A7E4UV06_PANRE